MKKTWVQDVNKRDSLKALEGAERDAGLHPAGSKYVLGKARSGEANEQGIYFEDPTAQD